MSKLVVALVFFVFVAEASNVRIVHRHRKRKATEDDLLDLEAAEEVFGRMKAKPETAETVATEAPNSSGTPSPFDFVDTVPIHGPHDPNVVIETTTQDVKPLVDVENDDEFPEPPSLASLPQVAAPTPPPTPITTMTTTTKTKKPKSRRLPSEEILKSIDALELFPDEDGEVPEDPSVTAAPRRRTRPPQQLPSLMQVNAPTPPSTPTTTKRKIPKPRRPSSEEILKSIDALELFPDKVGEVPEDLSVTAAPHRRTRPPQHLPSLAQVDAPTPPPTPTTAKSKRPKSRRPPPEELPTSSESLELFPNGDGEVPEAPSTTTAARRRTRPPQLRPSSRLKFFKGQPPATSQVRPSSRLKFFKVETLASPQLLPSSQLRSFNVQPPAPPPPEAFGTTTEPPIRYRLPQPKHGLLPYDWHVDPDVPRDAPRARGLVGVPNGWNVQMPVDRFFHTGYRPPNIQDYDFVFNGNRVLRGRRRRRFH